MKFEQFQQNVQEWSAARGIYEHSTSLAQALKAVSEVGELADAVIKKDMDALRDAIGDVAVCLVNVEAMSGQGSPLQRWPRTEYKFSDLQHAAAVVVQTVAECLDGADPKFFIRPWTCAAFDALDALAICAGLTFEECCQAAWGEIKDRTGHMVPGGAFVKEGPAA